MKSKRLIVVAVLLMAFALVISACGGGAGNQGGGAAQPTAAGGGGGAQPTASGGGGAQPTAAGGGGGGGGFSGNVIKIISSTPLTGGDSADGISMANSAKQALQDHGNKSGNYTLVLETWDDASAARGAWDPDVETSNANKAVADRSVLAYLGTYNSGAAKLSIPILNQAGPMVMVSGANTYVGLTKALPGVTAPGEPDSYYPTKVRNYARVVAPDDVQGAVDARWAKELGLKSVYIFDDQQLYGKGIADVYEKTAKELGINVLGHEGIDVKATDYSAQATKAVNLNPDGIYFGGVASSHPGLLWKAIKSAGFKGKLTGPDGMLSENFLKEAGADAEGTLLTFAGLPVDKLDEVSPKGKKWHQDYVKLWGGEPGVYGSYGYEAALVVLKAIDDCVAKNDVSRKCVRDAVFATKDFDGILGVKWSFDQNGDTTVATMTKNTVENGKFKFVGTAQ